MVKIIQMLTVFLRFGSLNLDTVKSSPIDVLWLGLRLKCRIRRGSKSGTQVVQSNQQGGQKLLGFGYEANYNDDLLQTWIGIGSQQDGLGHLGGGGHYYNCFDEKEISASPA